VSRHRIVTIALFCIAPLACREPAVAPERRTANAQRPSMDASTRGPSDRLIPDALGSPPAAAQNPKTHGKAYLRDAIEIGSGLGFSCALRRDGTVFCWGANGGGQLGDGSAAASATPVEVVGSTRFARLFVGDGSACGLTATGLAYCWGSNASGKLGTGSSAAFGLIPAPVSGGHAFTALSIGLVSTCGIGADLVTYCWGSNANGQLGAAVGASQATPVPVSGGIEFGALATGWQHTCAIALDGTLYC